MKKLVIATAIAAAATLSTGVHAQVSSNISAIELIVAGVPSAIDCATLPHSGFVTGLALSGTGISTDQINWTGQVCLDVGGGSPYVALVFALYNGEAVTSPSNGTTFGGGTITVYTDFGSGWAWAATVDASVTPIDCLFNSPTAAGLVWPAVPGTSPLPGAPTSSNAVCETTLLGLPSSIYLTGTKTY